MGSRSLVVQKASNTHTAVLVFPFVSPNVFSFAEKLATVVSSVATYTVLISGGVPNRIIWPSEVQVLDIGVRLHHIGSPREYIDYAMRLTLSSVPWDVTISCPS
jgi:hypothetical protein